MDGNQYKKHKTSECEGGFDSADSYDEDDDDDYSEDIIEIRIASNLSDSSSTRPVSVVSSSDPLKKKVML